MQFLIFVPTFVPVKQIHQHKENQTADHDGTNRDSIMNKGFVLFTRFIVKPLFQLMKMPLFWLAYLVEFAHHPLQVLDHCILDQVRCLEDHRTVEDVRFNDDVLFRFDNERVREQFAARALCKRSELAD